MKGVEHQMPNTKTAISIDVSIFEQMDALAKRLNMSRSRLFAIAAREFLQRNKNMDLLKSLNEAYADDEPDTDSLANKMKSRHYGLVEDQW